MMLIREFLGRGDAGMDHIIFNGWDSLVRTLVLGVLSYVALVVLLRVSGKRTLSKMNAFDFVVTIALGSTLATVLLSRDTSWAQGVVAFGLLIGLQYTVTWLSVRSPWVQKAVTGEPQMLLYEGEFIESALRSSRVTKDEIDAAIRASGLSDRSSARAVVLETDASFSVVRRSDAAGGSSLANVRGAPGQSAGSAAGGSPR
jgi:uncharacterized membrane protein YcaP (DUF421 family)